MKHWKMSALLLAGYALGALAFVAALPVMAFTRASHSVATKGGTSNCHGLSCTRAG